MFATAVCREPSGLRMVCHRLLDSPRAPTPTTCRNSLNPAQLTALKAPTAAGVVIFVHPDQVPDALRRRCHRAPPMTATICSAPSTPAAPIAVSSPSPVGVLSGVKLGRQPDAVRMVCRRTPLSTPSTCKLAPVAAQVTAEKVRSAPASGMLANGAGHCPLARRRLCQRLVSPPFSASATTCSAEPAPAVASLRNWPAAVGVATAVEAVQAGFGVRVVCRTSVAWAPTTCRLLSSGDFTPVTPHMLASIPTSP